MARPTRTDELQGFLDDEGAELRQLARTACGSWELGDEVLSRALARLAATTTPLDELGALHQARRLLWQEMRSIWQDPAAACTPVADPTDPEAPPLAVTPDRVAGEPTDATHRLLMAMAPLPVAHRMAIALVHLCGLPPTQLDSVMTGVDGARAYTDGMDYLVGTVELQGDELVADRVLGDVVTPDRTTREEYQH